MTSTEVNILGCWREGRHFV